MLFNAEKYRTGDEEIMVAGLSDEEEDRLEKWVRDTFVGVPRSGWL
jgi:hypothetical protein